MRDFLVPHPTLPPSKRRNAQTELRWSNARRFPALSILAGALALGLGPVWFAFPAGAAADPPADPSAAPATNDGSLFFDPKDGWLDISGFLATKAGFLAVPMIMTEPTLGYGGGASVVFVGPREGRGAEGFKRPNITAAGGVATENGTRVLFAADLRHWLDDRLKTVAAVVGGRVRLDFYGLGHDRVLRGNPLEYQLKIAGLRIGGKYRIGKSYWWVGASYQFFTVAASFAQVLDLPIIRRLNLGPKRTRLSGPIVSIVYDSRDTIFTPSSGLFSETTLGTSWEALGGTSTYQTLAHVTLGYLPLSETVTLGLRGDLKRGLGDPPFYVEPSIDMRGVPARRYQGKSVAQGEVEVRWQFWRRFSLVVFGGSGIAWADGTHFDRSESVHAGGIGFRYELARRFGLHYGMDVAYGPDGGTFYFQLGSAWMRP